MPLGIPHSVFLSWDEDDQDKALAYVKEQESVCDGCGTREEVWRQDRYAYVGWNITCPGCEIIEQENENVGEKSRGVKTMLVPREWALGQMEAGNLGSQHMD